MRDNNICKFVHSSITDRLEITKFILESNSNVIKKPFFLNTNYIFLILNGYGKFKFNQSEISFKKGDIIFGFQKETLGVLTNTECQYMYICFSGTRCEELFNRFGIKQSCRHFDGFEGLIPLWQESLNRASEETIDLASESILLYTFSRLMGSNVKQSTLINQIIEITEERFVDSNLSISFIAEKLSYNPKYLSHIFKKKMGNTYSEYLRSLRLRYAVSLFEHGIDSIKNVALLSGFTDPLYFSNVFKKNLGVSPKEYIKKHNKNI